MSKPVLINPYITEKTTRLMEEGKYVFTVDMQANKVQIRQAIKARYPDVRVRSVRTMVQAGKKRRQFTQRGMMEGRTSAYKKAVVTLDPEGPQIDFFESI